MDDLRAPRAAADALLRLPLAVRTLFSARDELLVT
jgi:hypothetical protein